MLRKKSIMTFGTVVMVTAFMVGVTYAWFTSEKTSANAVITAGMLDIDFVLDESDQEYKLYPKNVASEDEILMGTEGAMDYADIAQKTYTLTNKSDRHVLVEINAAALLAENGVTGSKLDEFGYVLLDKEGAFIPNILEGTEAVRFYYDVSGEEAVFVTIGDNAYVYLPEGAEAMAAMSVWIDGDSSGNEYQNAVLSFEGLTARATQYRKAALQHVFGLSDEALETIYQATGVEYE